MFLVWRWLDLPKPMGPRSTVAPARFIWRALSTIFRNRGSPSWTSLSSRNILNNIASLGSSISGPWDQKFSPCTNCQPTATHSRQNPVEQTILAKAENHLPLESRFHVCKLKEEKVVNPPHTPTTRSC